MALVLPLYTFRIKPEDVGEFIIEDAIASVPALYFPSMMRSLRLLSAPKLVRIPPRKNLLRQRDRFPREPTVHTTSPILSEIYCTEIGLVPAGYLEGTIISWYYQAMPS